ncbi:MAG TPA: Na+/H+ antiporter [Granulicella sp.]
MGGCYEPSQWEIPAAMLEGRAGQGRAMRARKVHMFSETSVHGAQMVLLLLMMIVAVFAALARWLKISYPIMLVVAGLLISFIPHIPRIPLNPNLVFLIFLPPLLYSSAWWTSWREFRANLLTITLMAIGLVAFTVWGIAEFADRFITLLDWKSGFILGAVVATTDAIAATSIAHSLGLPRRIVDILEGESLLNDATGLLALEFGLRLINQGSTPSFGESVMRLLYLIAVGVGTGLVVGVIVAWLERFIDDGPIEIVLSLIVPYVSYLAAESFHASGVLAVVASGLYLSRHSATFFSPAARIQVNGVWDALTFGLNGVVFVLIGLQLPYVLDGIRGFSRTTLLWYGAVFSAILILLRLVWTFPAVKLAYMARKRRGHDDKPPTARGVFVIGWTGMRGVIALAAAISLPETLANGQPFGARNLILFLTFSVILVTLVLQGLTLPPLIRALGLSSPAGVDEEERSARRAMLTAALEYLEEEESTDDGTFAHAFEDLVHRYQHRLAAVGGSAKGAHGEEHTSEEYQQMKEVARGALRVQRQVMIGLRDEGRLSDTALWKMERELDLEETRYMTPLH